MLVKQVAQLLHVALVEGIKLLHSGLLVLLHPDWSAHCPGRRARTLKLQYVPSDRLGNMVIVDLKKKKSKSKGDGLYVGLSSTEP